MGVILREALREFQGKGGGTKDFSQGSLANPAQAEALLKRAKDLLVF